MEHTRAAAAIAPTVTHRVRAFLAQQGADLKPWSGLDETYGELYSLLERKRDDPALWEPLAQLLRDVVDCVTDPEARCLPAPQAELLESWDIEELVEEMRAALPGDDGSPETSAFGTFTRRVSARVLGGFLLIGMVACGGRPAVIVDGSDRRDLVVDAAVDAAGDLSRDSSPDSAPRDTLPDPKWAEGCALDRSSILFATLRDSSVGDYQKGWLCKCFAKLNASWNDGLTELFQTGTPAQIAAALGEMMECCSGYDNALDKDFSAVRDAFLDGSLCLMPLPYRGVSFPEN